MKLDLSAVVLLMLALSGCAGAAQVPLPTPLATFTPSPTSTAAITPTDTATPTPMRLTPQPAPAEALAALEAAYQQRMYCEVVAEAGLLLSSTPGAAEIYHLRGLAYLSLGQPAEAVPQFELAAQLRPEDAQVHYWLGRSLLELGRYDEAQNPLRQAVSLRIDQAPEDELAFQAAADLAVATAQAQSVQAGYERLGRYVFIYGSRDALLTGYARLEALEGSYSEALRRLDDLVDTAYTPAFFWRGQVRLAAGNAVGAADDLAAFVEREAYGPTSEGARRQLQELAEVIDRPQ